MVLLVILWPQRTVSGEADSEFGLGSSVCLTWEQVVDPA